jgi:hypothetical protein
MQFDIGMLFVVIGFSTCSNTCYRIKYKKIKIVKSVKFHVIFGVVSYKSGLIYRNTTNNVEFYWFYNFYFL